MQEPKRIEMRIDRHVQRRQIDEVADDVGLGQFRQRQGLGGQGFRGSSSATGRTGTSHCGSFAPLQPGLESSKINSVERVFRIKFSRKGVWKSLRSIDEAQFECDLRLKFFAVATLREFSSDSVC